MTRKVWFWCFVFGSFASLFVIWPHLNTRLNYNEPVVHAEPYWHVSSPQRTSPLTPGKAITRWVEVKKTYQLDDHFPPAGPGSEMKFTRFVTLYAPEVVEIDQERRTVTFHQKGPFTVCGLRERHECKLFIVEEENPDDAG